ncbi:MAG: PilW family protein [Rubrivivax sp.]|nr:PilW family protein [Rubrivivax sp.]
MKQIPKLQPARRHAGGFTLVELMVAMTIGLVLALAVSLTMLSMGHQFRVVGATSAAQVNAQLALSLINEAGRSAGVGLFNNGQPLCPSFNAWRAGAVVSNGAPLMPARIIDGASATASDRLVFSASRATGPLSGSPVLDAMLTAAADIIVTDSAQLVANDLAIVGVPWSGAGVPAPCLLFQVTATPTVSVACGGNAAQCKAVPHTAGGSYNPPAGTFTTEPRYGFDTSGGVSGPAVVQRFGAEFRQEAYALLCDTLVQYNAFTDVPTCSVGPLAFAGGGNALVTDIVLMQAQYGITNDANDSVEAWVDASGGTWGNPSAADVGRIKAVRVVMVSRSKEPASELVTAAQCTNTAGIVNTGPCSFDDAEAPVIDLSGTTVVAGQSWRNYRYRVHQAVIPLRNVIWSN